MSKKRFAEAAFVAGSLLAGEAAAQNKQAETKAPQKTEQTKKQETSQDPQIREVFTVLEQRRKNVAGDEKLKKFIEQDAYKQIAQIIFKKLEKFNKSGSLSDSEEKELRDEARKMGLTRDLVNKCKDVLGEEKADIALLQMEKLLNRVNLALAPTSDDIKGPPNIFKK